MNRACALDFDPPRFTAGHCTVIQIDDTPTYELLVRRSFAAYLGDWFMTAGRGQPSATDAPPSRE